VDAMMLTMTLALENLQREANRSHEAPKNTVPDGGFATSTRSRTCILDGVPVHSAHDERRRRLTRDG
jgi:hypothetical protein